MTFPTRASTRTARVAIRAAALAAGAWLSAAATGGGGGGVPLDPAIERELAVQPAPGHTIDDAIAALTSMGLVDVHTIDSIAGRNAFLLSHAPQPGVELPQLEAMLGALNAAGVSTWAEVNYQSQSAESKTDSLWVTGIGFGDWYDQQYSVALMGLPSAHARTRGQGVIVAILDSGLDLAHPAIKGPMAVGAWNFVNDGPDVADVGNGADDDADGLIDEGVGHGTFVASLVRAVAPDALLLPVQVLDSEGRSDNFRVAKAMCYAIDHGAQVINMSLGTTYRSAAMEEATAEAHDKGIVVVGSMGNYGVSDPREFPASDNNAVGVAATDQDDVLADFSNFGARTDFCAPGASLVIGGQAEANASVIGAVPGGGYAAWRGTSFASAFVAGTAALVRAQHPEWPSPAVPPTAIVDEIVALLAAGSLDITPQNPGYKGELGHGRINAGASSLLSPPAPPLGDLDGNGSVSGADLGILIGQWGACVGCAADLDRDGTVDGADIGVLLAHWSP